MTRERARVRLLGGSVAALVMTVVALAGAAGPARALPVPRAERHRVVRR